GVFTDTSNELRPYQNTHKAQGKNERHEETAGKEPAETPLERVLDIVHRPAYKRAVFDNPGMLRHNRFGVNGSHAEEGAHPHPENRSRTAGRDGGGCSRDISCSYLSRDGGGQSLKGAEAVLSAFSVKREVAEQGFHAGAEFAHLDKAEQIRHRHESPVRQLLS